MGSLWGEISSEPLCFGVGLGLSQFQPASRSLTLQQAFSHSLSAVAWLCGCARPGITKDLVRLCDSVVFVLSPKAQHRPNTVRQLPGRTCERGFCKNPGPMTVASASFGVYLAILDVGGRFEVRMPSEETSVVRSWQACLQAPRSQTKGHRSSFRVS